MHAVRRDRFIRRTWLFSPPTCINKYTRKDQVKIYCHVAAAVNIEWHALCHYEYGHCQLDEATLVCCIALLLRWLQCYTQVPSETQSFTRLPQQRDIHNDIPCFCSESLKTRCHSTRAVYSDLFFFNPVGNVKTDSCKPVSFAHAIHTEGHYKMAHESKTTIANDSNK